MAGNSIDQSWLQWKGRIQHEIGSCPVCHHSRCLYSIQPYSVATGTRCFNCGAVFGRYMNLEANSLPQPKIEVTS